METKVYSWSVFDDKFAIKKTDKSAFDHRSSTIPREIYHFFNILDMRHGDRRNITLLMDGEHFSAYFTKEMLELGRIRLFWDSKISAHLRNNFKDYGNYAKADFPELVFRSITDILYEIFIISDAVYLDDVDRDDVFESYADGKETKVYTTRYERNPKNREAAIGYHGHSCMICGFNFEESYGNPGKGFIEVHHKVPVSQYEGELFIDPVQDMTCLCSNCHRMIHRKRNKTLSVEELQDYYDEAQKKKHKNQL